jgi:dolichol-phosphate mannosyltransferase
MKKAVIVIPTYNEKDNVAPLIEKVFDAVREKTNWDTHVLIVDSDSPDGTQQTVEGLIKKYPRLHLLKTKKAGLGRAYTEGFRMAIDKLNPFVLFEMDADLSHDPSKIPQFLEKIEKGADFVIGSRYIKDGSIPANWGLHRKILSVTANLFVRLGFMKLGVSDWTGGYRAIKVWIVKDAFSHIEKYSGYVFQVALLDFALSKNARVAEVPINFVDRTAGVSKINAAQYSLQTIWYTLSHSSFVKFVIVGLLGFAVDFSFAFLFINVFHMAKVVANIWSAEVAIVFNFLINNFWSFGHKAIKGGVLAYVPKFIQFNLVSLGSVAIQAAGMFLALKFLGDTTVNLGIAVPSWAIYKVLILAFVIIPYSYVLYNKVVWRNR